MEPVAYPSVRWQPWLVHLLVVSVTLAAVYVVSRVPVHHWAVAAYLAALAAGVLGSAWITLSAHFLGVVIRERTLSCWTWRGRRKIPWNDIALVTGSQPGGVLEVIWSRGTARISLDGRADAEALLLAIRARVPPSAWAVHSCDEAMLTQHLPRLEVEVDPVGAPSYRGTARPGRVVQTRELRPDVPAASWWMLGPALLVVFTSRGWGPARALLHHANAAVYWRRVETLFGPRVRLLEDGFVSLSGQWRYRAPAGEPCVYWEERDPATGALLESYRLQKVGAPAAAEDLGQEGDLFIGLPGWLGGRPRRLFRPCPLERAAWALRDVDWGEGSVTPPRTVVVARVPWQSDAEDTADLAIDESLRTLEEWMAERGPRHPAEAGSAGSNRNERSRRIGSARVLDAG